MYLLAFAPTVDQIQKHVYFENEKDKINATDWVKKNKLNIHVLRNQAKHEGISYNAKYTQVNKKYCQQKIDELETKLGFKEKSSNSSMDILSEKYKKTMERFQNVSVDPKKQTIQNLFNDPTKA